VLLVLPIVTVAFIASLLPFVYPETLFNIMGVQLNLVLGKLLAGLVPATLGTLVAPDNGSYGLTLMGVFAVYGPVLMLVLAALRSR